MRGSSKKDIDVLVSAVGSVSETDGLVRNDAAKGIAHMLGEDIARDLGDTIEELRLDPQHYSAVFKDKGLRLRAVTAISEKARVTDFPTDVGTIYSEFEQFMHYCDTFMISPTMGLFATWLGSSLSDYEQRVSHYRDARPDCADALDVCKELLRGFLETKALDGTVAPAVYLHQNKYVFGAVETAPAKVESRSDAHVRDMAQIAEVINTLPA